jgi:hypothetical protein
VRFAYADPPYPGQAKRSTATTRTTRARSTTRELVERLCDEFPDGWALSTGAKWLREVLLLCPVDVRVLSWVKTESRPSGSPTGSSAHFGIVDVGLRPPGPAGVFAVGLAFTLRDLVQTTLGRRGGWSRRSARRRRCRSSCPRVRRRVRCRVPRQRGSRTSRSTRRSSSATGWAPSR